MVIPATSSAVITSNTLEARHIACVHRRLARVNATASRPRTYGVQTDATRDYTIRRERCVLVPACAVDDPQPELEGAWASRAPRQAPVDREPEPWDEDASVRIHRYGDVPRSRGGAPSTGAQFARRAGPAM